LSFDADRASERRLPAEPGHDTLTSGTADGRTKAHGADRIIVHPRVLATIAALAALSVPGVARLCSHRLRLLAYWIGLHRVPGVQLQLSDGAVSLDLHLVVNTGFSLLEVSRQVQAAVERAVSQMTDTEVRQVNIYVDGVRAATYA